MSEFSSQPSACWKLYPWKNRQLEGGKTDRCWGIFAFFKKTKKTSETDLLHEKKIKGKE